MLRVVKVAAAKVLPNKLLNLIRRIRHGECIDWKYHQDGLGSMHSCDFIHEPRFAAAYAAGKRTGSWGSDNIQWRAHVVCWAAWRGRHLDGDFIECGVNRGGLAMAVAQYTELKTLKKRFFLLDTYQGFDRSYVTPREQEVLRLQARYQECYETVKRTFADFPNVEIIRGSVPETLPKVQVDKVSFLSLDMNCVTPEIAAAEFFWPKLVPGAAIVLDDYGWDGHQAQKQAFDDFAASHGVQVLSLPTGQGLIIKQ